MDGQTNAVLAVEVPADVPEWVMIAHIGAWRGHPGGPEVVTPEMLQSALSYFDRHYKVHAADLTIDYHHQSVLASAGRVPKAPAAGWIKEMVLRENGTELWGRVMWNADAAREIGAREFRYLSPVFRFNASDRVTAEPVPMMIHSVALTNTPFLTELESLNEVAATDGGGNTGPGVAGTRSEEDESMTLFEALGAALGKTPDEVASSLGLEAGAEDKAVAEALIANAAHVKELEARLAEPMVVNDAISGLLGLEKGAAEKAVKAKIMGLQLHAGTSAVRKKLGLDDAADDGAVLNAIGELQTQKHEIDAEALTAKAIAEGKIAPAHREALFQMALNDLDATEALVNSLQSQTDAPAHGNKPGIGGPRALTETESKLCDQLHLKPEEFLGVA